MTIQNNLEDYTNYMRAIGAQLRTIEEHTNVLKKYILPVLGKIELSKLTYNDIGTLREFAAAKSETGPQRSIKVLRCVLRFLSKNNEISIGWYEIPIPRTRQKPVEYLNKLELKELRDSFTLRPTEEVRLRFAGGIKMVESTKYALLRTRVLIELILCTGLRISEALNITMSDIDWNANEISVVNAKTKDRETVYVSDYALDWLKGYLPYRGDSEYLFTSDKNKFPFRGNRMGKDTAKSFLYHHCKRLPDPIKKHIYYHILRKTFVTNLLQEGMDLPSVRSVARHKSERTTLRYYGAVGLERAKKMQLAIMNRL